MATETTAVRANHAFDQDKLRNYLAQQLGQSVTVSQSSLALPC